MQPAPRDPALPISTSQLLPAAQQYLMSMGQQQNLQPVEKMGYPPFNPTPPSRNGAA